MLLEFIKVLIRKFRIRRLLKGILQGGGILDISQALGQIGFSQVPERESNGIYIENFINADLVACVKTAYKNAEVELSWYNNLYGYEKRNVITVIFINKKKNHIYGHFYGMFINATYEIQRMKALDLIIEALSLKELNPAPFYINKRRKNVYL